MKVLFLDIDGVLNNMQMYMGGARVDSVFVEINDDDDDATIRNKLVKWDLYNVDNLKHILDVTGAHIVLSSSWRKWCSIESFKKILDAYEIYAKILGITPTIYGKIRGAEIEEYLKGNDGIESYVILDDDSDFYDNQPLVLVNNDIGLTVEDAEKAIRILNGI